MLAGFCGAGIPPEVRPGAADLLRFARKRLTPTLGATQQEKECKMNSLPQKIRLILLYLLSIITGLISLFFVFYTVRLLYVTHGLSVINTGGQGAFIGAIVFPLLAIGFGFIAWISIKSIRSKKK